MSGPGALTSYRSMSESASSRIRLRARNGPREAGGERYDLITAFREMLIDGREPGPEPVLGYMTDAGCDRLARVAAPQTPLADANPPG